MIALAAANGRFFAGSGESLLFSTDRGRNWQTNQSFPRLMIRSLLPLNGALYVGTDGGGVYKTREIGSKDWTHLAAGLPPNAQVLALTSR